MAKNDEHVRTQHRWQQYADLFEPFVQSIGEMQAEIARDGLWLKHTVQSPEKAAELTASTRALLRAVFRLIADPDLGASGRLQAAAKAIDPPLSTTEERFFLLTLVRKLHADVAELALHLRLFSWPHFEPLSEDDIAKAVAGITPSADATQEPRGLYSAAARLSIKAGLCGDAVTAADRRGVQSEKAALARAVARVGKAYRAVDIEARPPESLITGARL